MTIYINRHKKIGKLARLLGYKVRLSDSKTTNSKYLYCYYYYKNNKEKIVFRFSDHPKPDYVLIEQTADLSFDPETQLTILDAAEFLIAKARSIRELADKGII